MNCVCKLRPITPEHATDLTEALEIAGLRSLAQDFRVTESYGPKMPVPFFHPSGVSRGAVKGRLGQLKCADAPELPHPQWMGWVLVLAAGAVGALSVAKPGCWIALKVNPLSSLVSFCCLNLSRRVSSNASRSAADIDALMLSRAVLKILSRVLAREKSAALNTAGLNLVVITTALRSLSVSGEAASGLTHSWSARAKPLIKAVRIENAKVPYVITDRI